MARSVGEHPDLTSIFDYELENPAKKARELLKQQAAKDRAYADRSMQSQKCEWIPRQSGKYGPLVLQLQ